MKRMEVASVVQRIQFLNNRKVSIEQNMRKTLELVQGGASMEWTVFYGSKMELDVKESHRLENLVKDEELLLKDRQKELAEIMLKKKSLESLRDKRWKDHRNIQSRKLQKELDEIYQLSSGIK